MTSEPNNQPDELTGTLAETVQQMRDQPMPSGLGQQAISRAAPAGGNHSWTPRRIASWSAIAASIVVIGFLSGQAITHWSHPAASPSVVADADSPTPNVAVAAAGTEAPTTEVGEALVLQKATRATTDLTFVPQGQPAPAELVLNDGPVRLTRARPVDDLPAEVQAILQQNQVQTAQLTAQRAQLDAQQAAQRAQLVETLSRMQARYAAAGQTQNAAAVQRQIAALNLPAVATQILAAPALEPGRLTTQQPPETLTAYRGQVGQTLQIQTVGFTTGTIWGSNNIYTDDSPLGVAAVHAGVLKVGEKAVLNVKILPGQANYDGTTQNGITSTNYGPWEGSYQILGKGAAVEIFNRPPAIAPAPRTNPAPIGLP